MSVLSKQLDAIDHLTCENEDVIIEGFMDRYNVDADEAREIFEETKKWLWLASKATEDGGSLFIDRSLLILDEMWHTFILHTKQYYNFCLSNFKKIIHHKPTPAREKVLMEARLAANPEAVQSEQEAMLKRQYSFIYDHLGPETLLKWYDILPKKYTPEYISAIKKA